MSDRIFFKRVSKTMWLGLRMPSDLKIVAGPAGPATAQRGWAYDTVSTVLPDWVNRASVWMPDIVIVFDGAQPSIKLELSEAPMTGSLPGPFARLRASLDALPPTFATVRKDLLAQIDDAAGSVSLPLLAQNAYLGLDYRADSGNVQGWLEPLLGALGGTRERPRAEAFSGMLFLVSQAGPPPGSAMIDNPLGDPKPELLRVAARQSAGGVTLNLRDDQGRLLTNRRAPRVILNLNEDAQDPPFSPSYRWTRTLGIAGASPRESGRIALPVVPPAGDVGAGTVAWADRPLALVDRMEPGSLTGELLEYRVELFNHHGRCTHAGRAMLRRARMDQVAPPSELLVRLRFASEPGRPPELITQFHLPNGESAGQLQAILYKLDTPVVASGFYGDADDFALMSARVLSDLDPGAASAALLSGHMPALTVGSVEGLDVTPNLSNHGLTRIATGEIRPGLADTKDGLKAPCDVLWKPVPGARAGLLPPEGRSAQYFVSLCRTDTAAPDATKPVPIDSTESLVASARHELAFAVKGAVPPDAGEIARPVPHLEDFWSSPAAATRRFMGSGQARVVEVPPTPGAAAVPAELVVDIQHVMAPDTAAAAADAPTGGYRLWVRDVPGPASTDPFLPVAVVQALPPLVKAYAPVEAGRAWALTNLGPPVFMPPVPPGPHSRPNLPEVIPLTAGSDGLAQKRMTEALASLSESLRPEVATPQELGDALWKFAGEATASGHGVECLLPVAVRRRIERLLLATIDGMPADFKPAAGQPLPQPGFHIPGTFEAEGMFASANWILALDQNSRLLGRAWAFWPPEKWADPNSLVRRIMVLTEQPSAQDSVAIDEFGRIRWRWKGLSDLWRHELEWHIEALDRYEPIRGVRNAAAQGQERNSRYATLPDSAEVPLRLSVQRREPLTGVFGLVPRLDAQRDDAFVIQVLTPPEFRQAARNALARTRLGVLRVHPRLDATTFLHAVSFSSIPIPDSLNAMVKAWCTEYRTGAKKVAEPVLPLVSFPESGSETAGMGEVLLEMPACFAVDLSLEASADGQYLGEAPQGTVPRLQHLRRSPVCFAPPEPGHDDRVIPTGPASVRIPLARLDWSWSGKWQGPPLSEAGGALGTALDQLPGAGDLKARPLLRLPDPLAEIQIYVPSTENPLVYILAAVFRGSELPAFQPEDKLLLTQGGDCIWGTACYNPALVGAVTLNDDTEGRLSILFNGAPSRVHVQWCRLGRSHTPADFVMNPL